jgi:hypothetical protein
MRVLGCLPRSGKRIKAAARSCVSAAMLLAAAGLAHGAELSATHANDLFSANRIEDDLYTFSAELAFRHQGWSVRAWENAFTDQDNEIRFDESYFTIARDFPCFGWRARLEIGAVRIGEGVLGEDSQNTIHRLIGQDEIHLPYVDENRNESVAAVELWRPYALAPSVSLVPRFRVFHANDFVRHFTATTTAHWQRGKVRYLAGAGWRFFETDYDLLEPWLEESAPTWEVGADLFDHLVLKWTQNRFGTNRRYFEATFSWKFD